MLISIAAVVALFGVVSYFSWSLLRDTILVFLSPFTRWLKEFVGLCALCGGVGGILTTCALSTSWILTLGICVACLPLAGLGIAWSHRPSSRIPNMTVADKLDNLHVTRH
jgi:hypothetical protein